MGRAPSGRSGWIVLYNVAHSALLLFFQVGLCQAILSVSVVYLVGINCVASALSFTWLDFDVLDLTKRHPL